jgi:YfiH family protein
MNPQSPRCLFPSLDSLGFIEYDFGLRTSTPPADVVTVHQVHSARVIANAGEPSRQHEDADALIDNTRGIALGIKTADCVPILLADPERRAIGAVHAGWRGTAQQIVPATLRAMVREYGTRPEAVHAAIGPSIGVCCYEVGREVAREFGIEAPSKVHLDLRAINAGQLKAAGVVNISISNECTMCSPDRYHSFRRDAQSAGRLISWIRLLA